MCSLRASVQQPAPAGCLAAARGEARWLRRQHLLPSTGRRPATGTGLLHCCCARGGTLAPTTTSSALYGPPSGSCLRPVAGLRRAGRLAGSDETITCNLRGAVWQPAPAGCRAAARGGLQDSTTPSSALCGPTSGSRLRPVAGAGGSCPDDTMFCHLQAAVRHLASVGCWRVPPTALYGPHPALEPDHNLP